MVHSPTRSPATAPPLTRPSAHLILLFPTPPSEPLSIRESPLADFDKKALDANFQSWKNNRMPEIDDGMAFELYSIGAILRDHDLSDDDIDSGHIGGKDDGGVDGVYFFVDGTLMIDEDHPLPDKTQLAELLIIQVKRSGGFSETVVDRITSFVRDVLEWGTPTDALAHLNAQARDCIALFRTIYAKIIRDVPLLRVTVHYVTGSPSRSNSKVASKLQQLTTYVRSKVSHVEISPEFWDCVRLLDAVRAPPKHTFDIPTRKMFTTDDGAAAVCLVRITDMARLLTDGAGGQRKTLLESNIRAYQGNVQVNKDIRQTLRSGDGDRDFWWFNNGVTVLADACHFSGNTIVLETPRIVNGLQTCHEIFDYVTEVNPTADHRSVLLRVIIPPDPNTRNTIIKATNFQTAITPVSLRAMDTLHFNIEDRLRLYGLYYDRRKGEYRAQQKPRSRIVSIRDLGKAVISIVLQRPDTARARPGTVLNSADRYEEVFPDDADTETYATCIRIDRRVQGYLVNQADLDRGIRADVRYYVVLLVACVLASAVKPGRGDIAALGRTIPTALSDDVISECVDEVLGLYNSLGGTDKVSKGPELLEALRLLIADRLAN